ncbi:MAG: NnrS family protein [Pseudomonadota bacterium]|nr:NnrS family protein [Pseudomonadota bacterium]
MQILFKTALFNLGFRPFFLGSAVFAVISMTFWMFAYSFQQMPLIAGISLFQWHAHEMIYGFAVAVVAGFLLTAVKNWTGVQTLHGLNLLGLWILWMLPRIVLLFGTPGIGVAAFFDLLFMLGLIAAIVYPIVKVKQWWQLGIVTILVLLLVANSCFYLGAIGIIDQGARLGIYSGLFLIIGMILVIGRRVIPFFIEAGVGYPVKLVNYQWLDQLIIAFYVVFLIAELGVSDRWMIALSAMGLGIANSVRLVGWYTHGVWKKPLLWSLFVSFIFINLGFFLTALNAIFALPNIVAIHAFSIGGIGVITLSMMARVILGHTGRNIQEPPKAVTVFLMLMIIATVFRVVFPLIMMDYYVVWIVLSQILWIAAFLMFIVTYAPMLVKPRVDGQFG